MNSKEEILTIKNSLLSSPTNIIRMLINEANIQSHAITTQELANAIFLGLGNLTKTSLGKGTEDDFVLLTSQLINIAPTMFAIIENKKMFIYFMA